MSRFNMLYDDKPLSSVPVKNIDWPGLWNPHEIFGFSKGNGLLIEGKLLGKSRFAINQQSTKEKVRYIVLHVEVLRAHKRQFDKLGKEVEPNFSQTKKVNTGFLMSSYKTCAKGETDLVASDQVADMVKVPDLDKLTKSHLAMDMCSSPSVIAVWCDEGQLDKTELSSGENIRLKTKGSGPFVEMLAKIEEGSVTVANYAGGESVGASWTDKVMAMKTQDTPQSSEEPEGVDESEWDD